MIIAHTSVQMPAQMYIYHSRTRRIPSSSAAFDSPLLEGISLEREFWITYSTKLTTRVGTGLVPILLP